MLSDLQAAGLLLMPLWYISVCLDVNDSYVCL